MRGFETFKVLPRKLRTRTVKQFDGPCANILWLHMPLASTRIQGQKCQPQPIHRFLKRLSRITTTYLPRTVLNPKWWNSCYFGRTTRRQFKHEIETNFFSLLGDAKLLIHRPDRHRNVATWRDRLKRGPSDRYGWRVNACMQRPCSDCICIWRSLPSQEE